MLALALGLSLVAASPSSLLPHRARVLPAPGPLPWVRLPLTDEVLAKTKPDLSDVRLLDAEGQPVALRLVTRAPEGAALEPVPARVLSVSGDGPLARNEKRPSTRRTFELELPPLPNGAARWRLDFSLPDRAFTAHATLTRGGTFLAEGLLFRLRAPASEKLSVELPENAGRGPVRLDTTVQGPSPLEAQLTWVPIPAGVSRTAWRFSPEARVRSADGTTTLRLQRPSGVVPNALELDTATPSFSRRVRVLDVSPSGVRTPLAEETLARVAGSGTPRTRVALGPAQGADLELEIQDADSAPLEQPRVTLLAERPTLLFSLSEAQRARPLHLYFGGGLARAPRYDLAALPIDDAWSATAGSPSTLGDTEPNPDFSPAPAAASLVRPGTPLDASAFRSRRALDFSGGVGPWRVPLDVQDAAVLRADAADVRVVDATGHPWPRRADTRSVEHALALSPLPRRGTTSSFAVALPASPAMLERFLLAPPPYVFERTAHFEGEDEAGRRFVLPPLQLRRDPTGRAGGDVLDLSPVLPSVRVRALELHVEDGQEQPLEGLTARAAFRVPELQVFAPAGRYTLLLGSPRQDAPRDELDVVQAAFEELAPLPVAPGPLEPNPAYRAPGPLSAQDVPTLFLWGGLVLAVAVLGGLALKLSRQLPD